jgi:Tol biopolymer transport system component
VGDTKWFQLTGAAWLPDGSGIVLAAVDRKVSRLGQVWLVDYPSGKVRRVTNDLNNYLGVSVTSDGKTIATIQSNSSSNLISVTPFSGNVEKALTRGTQENAIAAPVALPEGGVMQVTVADGKSQVSEITPAGERKQMPIGEDTIISAVSMSRDGRVLLGTRLRDGAPHVVKMERDGSNMVELTHGSFENAVRVSPDGTWFLYRTGDATVMRMSTSGGAAKMIAPHTEGRPAISPDGTRVTVDVQEQHGDRASAFMLVVPANGGAPIARFPADGVSSYSFSPEGDALDYVLRTNGVDNVWRQALSGGAPKQLTALKEGAIGSFVWMADGKTLVLSRPQTVSDVVLISDFR